MKDYARQQHHPRKHGMALLLVVLLHLVLFGLISSGLGQKMVKAVQVPVQAMLIQDTQPTPPPTPPAPPPPPPTPKRAPPPPDALMPVTPLANATPSVNAPTAVSAAPAPAAPAAAPVRVAPAMNAAASCAKPAYPSASVRNEEEGTVHLRFLIGTEGQVLEVQVEKSSGFKRLDEAARLGLARCQFKPGTVNGQAEQSWVSMRYTWRLE